MKNYSTVVRAFLSVKKYTSMKMVPEYNEIGTISYSFSLESAGQCVVNSPVSSSCNLATLGLHIEDVRSESQEALMHKETGRNGAATCTSTAEYFIDITISREQVNFYFRVIWFIQEYFWM